MVKNLWRERERVEERESEWKRERESVCLSDSFGSLVSWITIGSSPWD